MNKELHKETDKRIKGPALSTSFESVTSDSLYINAYGAKRLRRPNFKQEELETLVTLLEERPELASGKIGGLYCNADAQRLAWQEVAALVSGVGEAERTGREIREKWIDFKSRVKQKYRKIKDVEDGIAEEGIAIPLTPLEVRILDMVNATSNSQSQNSPSEVTRVVEYHPPGKIKDDRITKPFTLIESSGSGKSSTAHGAKRKKSGPRITTIEVGRTVGT